MVTIVSLRSGTSMYRHRSTRRGGRARRSTAAKDEWGGCGERESGRGAAGGCCDRRSDGRLRRRRLLRGCGLCGAEESAEQLAKCGERIVVWIAGITVVTIRRESRARIQRNHRDGVEVRNTVVITIKNWTIWVWYRVYERRRDARVGRRYPIIFARRWSCRSFVRSLCRRSFPVGSLVVRGSRARENLCDVSESTDTNEASEDTDACLKYATHAETRLLCGWSGSVRRRVSGRRRAARRRSSTCATASARYGRSRRTRGSRPAGEPIRYSCPDTWCNCHRDNRRWRYPVRDSLKSRYIVSSELVGNIGKRRRFDNLCRKGCRLCGFRNILLQSRHIKAAELFRNIRERRRLRNHCGYRGRWRHDNRHRGPSFTKFPIQHLDGMPNVVPQRRKRCRGYRSRGGGRYFYLRLLRECDDLLWRNFRFRERLHALKNRRRCRTLRCGKTSFFLRRLRIPIRISLWQSGRRRWY